MYIYSTTPCALAASRKRLRLQAVPALSICPPACSCVPVVHICSDCLTMLVYQLRALRDCEVANPEDSTFAWVLLLKHSGYCWPWVCLPSLTMSEPSVAMCSEAETHKPTGIPSRRQPVSRVHVDFTVQSGPVRLKSVLPEEAERLLKTPFAVVQACQCSVSLQLSLISVNSCPHD